SAADLIEAEKEDESSENQPLTDVTENSPETDDLPDTDQDGIPDSADLCPNSQVSEKTRMDQLGCEKGMTIKLEGVNFEKGSATLTAVSLPILEQTLTVLKNVPEITLEVGGYTDSKGNEQSNLQLSQRRAEAVQQYFLAQGLSANHVLAKGYGEAQAIADNNTAEGRAKNRRVELKVLD
ncbi:MAG: OmpA family protein, partial [bacterium]